MKTVIVIPTYNEAGNILSIVPRIFSVVPDVSILVVDDNSPDGTAKEVETLMKTEPRISLLKRPKKEGLGRAYVHAFMEVLKDPAVERIVMMDADHSHDPAFLPHLLAGLAKAEMAIGSRYIKGGATEGWEAWRKILSIYGNLYTRIVTGMPVGDATGGFNALRAEALRKAPLSELNNSGYAFQMELKYRLWKQGARLIEVPIRFKVRREGESKLTGHIVREGLLAPWKMRFRK